MRGIECVFPSPNKLFTFLKFCGMEMCKQKSDSKVFYVLDQAVYSRGKRIYIPTQFDHNLLISCNDSLLIFERLVLHIYPPNTQPSTIDTYGDYLLSNCLSVVLIYDGVFLEIYTKDSGMAEALYNNAILSGAKEVVFKKADTDFRNTMFV